MAGCFAARLFASAMSASRLAVWTEMRRSSPDHDAANRRPAFRAGLAFPRIDAVELLEVAGFSVGVAVVPQRAAAMVEGAAKNCLDCAGQIGDLPGGEVVRANERMNPGGEERFVHVDIPQPGDQGLIEQRGFDDAGGFRQPGGEVGCAEGKRLGAHRAVIIGRIPQPPDAAEAPRIAEAEDDAVSEAQLEVRVLGGGLGQRLDAESAGHSEMDVESLGVVEREDDAFAAAMNIANQSADQQLGKIDCGGIEDISPRQLDGLDSPGEKARPERIDDGLHFG